MDDMQAMIDAGHRVMLYKDRQGNYVACVLDGPEVYDLLDAERPHEVFGSDLQDVVTRLAARA